MTHASLWALLGFTVWTLCLVLFGIGVPRLTAVLTRKAPPKAFPGDQPHGGERYRRTMRAHANCVENLPVFAVLVLSSHAVALESSLFEVLAVAVLPARVLQSALHIASGANRAIVARFYCFLLQLACFFAMAVLIALALAR